MFLFSDDSCSALIPRNVVRFEARKKHNIENLISAIAFFSGEGNGILRTSPLILRLLSRELLKYYVWFISHKANNVRELIHKSSLSKRWRLSWLLSDCEKGCALECPRTEKFDKVANGVAFVSDLRNQSLVDDGLKHVPKAVFLVPKSGSKYFDGFASLKGPLVVHHPIKSVFLRCC